jgi:methylenetetrahydrofolate--tRNA-(uracil-5-)-methyltransferase
LLFAGQLVGVEGYTESLGTGLLAGINLARMLAGAPPAVPPPETMLGALMRYVHLADPAHFQPMNANFGLLPDLPQRVKDKDKKRERLAERALAAMGAFVEQASAVPA